MDARADTSTLDETSFANAYGEPLDRVLNLDTWERDPDLAALCQRIENEVGEAVQTENSFDETTRREIFGRLANRPGAPAGAGVYQATSDQLIKVCKQVLFNGAVEVCDGTRKEFETLPLTITQIGVCLASYQGNQQSFAHRLYQRDLRMKSGDLLEDLLALLDNRKRRNDNGVEERSLSTLARRAIMTFAERSALTYRSSAPWRMGHGNPCPYELMSGAGIYEGGNMVLLHRSLDVLTDLIANHKRFVFVPSESADKRLLTLGHALKGGEYAIVQTAQADLLKIVDEVTVDGLPVGRAGHYNREDRKRVMAFCKEIGDQIGVGIYRAAESAPPYLFYGHVDHMHEAALIVLADSLLQDHRGFPLLIDLADRLCRVAFGNDIFDGAIQNAYARAGAPFRFLGERQTRG
jgi:hypothetical protein